MDRSRLLDVEALRSLLLDAGPILWAIDGCGGAGKSTLARSLAVPGRTGIVQVDDFALPSGRRATVPTTPGFIYDLERLEQQVLDPRRDGLAVRYQRYDWDADRLGSWVEIDPGVAVIVEGIYSTCTSLRDRYGLRIWVDAPPAVRLERGAARDGEGMRRTWLEEWMPAENRYVDAEDPAAHAHLVVDGSGDQRGPTFRVLRSSVPGI